MTREPSHSGPGAPGPSGSADAAAATGELLRMPGPPHGDSADRKGFSGFCEQPLPVGSPLPPGPFRRTKAGVSVQTLPVWPHLIVAPVFAGFCNIY
ncbi:hypothetical protein MC885_019375 [Smutsia gigantea]|nr:hypothetical protein MC885_019375 [Smutsia gigantea]